MTKTDILLTKRKKEINGILRFVVFMAVMMMMMMMFFWVLAPCRLSPENGDSYASLKSCHLPTGLHGARTQKNI
jgi:hypothetical protein